MIDSTVKAIPGAGRPADSVVSVGVIAGGVIVWSLNKNAVSTVSVIVVHSFEASQALTVTVNTPSPQISKLIDSLDHIFPLVVI